MPSSDKPMAENPAQSSAQQEKQPANTTPEINKPAASNAVDAKAVDAKADVATAEIQSMAENKPEAQKATPATPETGKAEMPTASQAKPQLKNAAVDKETAKPDKAKPDQAKPAVVKKTPAPKLEDKPFEIFIREDFIPSLSQALNEYGLKPTALELNQGKRPVVGGSCWMVSGDIPSDRRFWLCFSSDSINSSKTIALADPGTEPSLLEPFLIDEKKTTLPLLRSRLLQRLNGQKWLGAN